MSRFNFGGRVIPPTEFKVPVNKEVAKPDAYSTPEPTETLEFDPQVLAFLIVRCIRVGEWNLAQSLLRTMDTGTTHKARVWQYQVCACCGAIYQWQGLSFVVGICDHDKMEAGIENLFRLQQTFLHLSSKLDHSTWFNLHRALETTLNKS